MNPKSVFVVGLGQIGGSLILAWKKDRFFSSISGFDARPEVRSAAARGLKIKFADFQNGVAAADVVVLATPVPQILKALAKIARLSARPLVIDVGSTKGAIMRWANRQDKSFRFIGAHPMAGTEKSGPSGWNRGLFEDRPFFLCPRRGAASTDVTFVKSMIRSAGARPVEVDPVAHDSMLAKTSHLPYFLSVALINLMGASKKSDQFYRGPGFDGASRLAASDPSMMMGIARTNARAISDVLSQFEKRLTALRRQVDKGHWRDLESSFRSASRERNG